LDYLLWPNLAEGGEVRMKNIVFKKRQTRPKIFAFRASEAEVKFLKDNAKRYKMPPTVFAREVLFQSLREMAGES
jgi:hypothetical protein